MNAKLLQEEDWECSGRIESRAQSSKGKPAHHNNEPGHQIGIPFQHSEIVAPPRVVVIVFSLRYDAPVLSWLFGTKDQATRGEDCMWMSGAARLKGIGREIERLAKDCPSIVVVAWTLPAFDELARELERHKPLLCRDLFGFDALHSQLTRTGSVAVALATTLSSDVKPPTTVPVEILVCGRNDLRATDDTLVGFADVIGANARVTFHLALDDALLRDYIGCSGNFSPG